MRLGNKAELLTCLDKLAPKHLDSPQVDVKIIDGAALVHVLDPKTSNNKVNTFQD